MRQAVPAFLLTAVFAQASQSAEGPPGAVVQNLTSYAYEGCEFLRRASHLRKSRRPTARQMASHFGKIVDARSAGTFTEYVLTSSAFPGWKVLFRARSVDLYLPDGVNVLVSDFEARLGKAGDPDIDYAARSNTPSETTSGVSETPRLLEFERTKEHPFCGMRIETDGHGANVHRQRVTMFEFHY